MRWTLENLIDFEQSIAADFKASPGAQADILEATRGLDGIAARGTGLRLWLDVARQQPSAGRRFTAALSLVAMIFGFIAWLAGVSAVLGMWDRTRGGIDVVIFLAVLIGGQWLLLVVAAIAWMFRRRTADGFSALQAVIGKLARRFADTDENGWWDKIMDTGGAPRAALLWHLARLAQQAGVRFNFGIICGLAGLVLVRNVGFYWETTTETAMRGILENAIHVLALPWSAWWPAAVPDGAAIDASRWLPTDSGRLSPGPSSWWLFLIMATFVWGLLPRLLLWFLAGRASRTALSRLDFQARHHRTLWRNLTGSERVETDEKPTDGVLVLDVGGSGLRPEDLRPFLLQKLRVHPAAWNPVAVLNPGAESEAAAALALAPAGIVLLAEGWALSPARMMALHTKIRAATARETPLKFLVANEGADHRPIAPTDEERHQWECFVDSLRDPFAEIYFYA